MGNELTVLLVLLFLSGFFSSAETALFSISRTKAIHIAKEGGRTNQLIRQMKDDPHRLLSTILIGNNVVNVGASALATSITIQMVSSNAVGVATGIMTFLILVFGEVFPKTIATRNNLLVARIVILPIYWMSILFYPVILFLNFIPRITGKIKKTPSLTEEELMTFVEVVEEEGEIKEEEKEFIHNIFEFDDTNASEIMTPRGDMFALDIDEKPDFGKIGKSGFTRIPVYLDTIDNIVGIINIKDIFIHQSTEADEPDIKKLMNRPYFIPENKKLDQLLHQFKKRKHHIAIIVDEHGGVGGLITMEDVLEEIVGEISDESDKIEPHITRIRENEWAVLGKSEIDEVNETIPMDIPESMAYDTFSGYILDQIGRIPMEKDKISVGDFRVTVKAMDGNRILEYIVRKET
ncbi:MAG: HlyC/CorC family transporter [Deltaproteobacteria bacterium]|nr:HlyC/CorC family transporter [Deltaproteobacteria bacterium]